jgi:hypothetical protein
MQGKTLISLVFLGLGGSLSANAQTPGFLATPKAYYVGVQAGSSRYEMFYRSPAVTPTVFVISPWLLTAGYYLTPRLAVQVSFTHSRTTYDSPGGIQELPNGQLALYNIYHEEDAQTAIPIVLRWALSKPGTRLQADAILGITWGHHFYKATTYDQLNGKITREYAYGNQGSLGYLTAGIGGRYGISQHFEATGDITWNRTMNDESSAVHRQVSGNSLGLTRSMSIGVRYRFNLRKPTAIIPANP